MLLEWSTHSILCCFVERGPLRRLVGRLCKTGPSQFLEGEGRLVQTASKRSNGNGNDLYEFHPNSFTGVWSVAWPLWSFQWRFCDLRNFVPWIGITINDRLVITTISVSERRMSNGWPRAQGGFEGCTTSLAQGLKTWHSKHSYIGAEDTLIGIQK